eukprot:Skav223339  [mRNA]  locus=scaffold200:265029:269553:+ [translate_table: standard]
MEGTLLDAVRSSDDQERLSRAALPRGDPPSALQEVARLLAAGADPNEPDELGETPIFEAPATAGGDANIVALLLMSRADPEYRSSQGMVARQMALDSTALLLDLCLGKFQGKLCFEAGVAMGGVQPEVVKSTEEEEKEACHPGEEASEDRPLHPEICETFSPSSQGEVGGKEKEHQETTPMLSEDPQEPGDLPDPLEGFKPVEESVEKQLVSESHLEPQLNHEDSEAVGQHDLLEPDGQTSGDLGDLTPQEEVEGDPVKSVDSDVASALSASHVVLHSPMIAVRRKPCMRSPVLRYLRPGDRIDLAEWDESQQWRRVPGEDAWVPVRHPTLGVLARAEGKDHFAAAMGAAMGLNGKGGLTVKEAWRQLYEGGILNIPPPDGDNVASVAGQALAEAATTGRAQTMQGEKALASLDLATVEYVMTAALQHLHLQN